jgi:hypothetical protein
MSERSLLVVIVLAPGYSTSHGKCPSPAAAGGRWEDPGVGAPARVEAERRRRAIIDLGSATAARLIDSHAHRFSP